MIEINGEIDVNGKGIEVIGGSWNSRCTESEWRCHSIVGGENFAGFDLRRKYIQSEECRKRETNFEFGIPFFGRKFHDNRLGWSEIHSSHRYQSSTTNGREKPAVNSKYLYWIYLAKLTNGLISCTTGIRCPLAIDLHHLKPFVYQFVQ